MENVFDTLCSALLELEVKRLFHEGEGVDLMLIMMRFVIPVNVVVVVTDHDTCREKLLARSRAIKVLDHALSGAAGTINCETFVEALGLKTLFSSLMGKVRYSSWHSSVFHFVDRRSFIE